MTTGEWSCLISFTWAPLTCSEWGGSEKFKMKIYISSGIRTNGAVANENKHIHSPEVIIVFRPQKR